MDHTPALTGVNLVTKLFFNEPLKSQRLIRLGLFPGCLGVAVEAALTDVGQRRTPDQRAADLRGYEWLVAVAQKAELFQLNGVRLPVMVFHALHLEVTKQHATISSVAFTPTNSWALHTVSGTNQSNNKTTKS